MARMVRSCLLLMLCASAWSQPSVSDLIRERTLERLREYERSFDGALGAAFLDLEGGQRFHLNGDTVFPQASVIKIPVMVTLYEAARAGRLSLDDQVAVQPGELIGGSQYLKPRLERGPASFPLRELIRGMIILSDNTATNKCIAAVGMEQVNRLMESLGFKNTRLRRIMLDGAAASRDEENVSTPNEMAQLVRLIAEGQAVSPEASRQMLDIMREVDGAFRQGLPLDTPVAVKTGAIPGSRSESGVIWVAGRPFVLSVMSAYIDDRRSPVPEVVRVVYPLMEKLARSNRYGHRVR
ncbi:MAG: serine hydrolase [Bryobacterales bacterium]|nr:serine hydrolase [Bryobacterales bacterium]